MQQFEKDLRASLDAAVRKNIALAAENAALKALLASAADATSPSDDVRTDWWERRNAIITRAATSTSTDSGGDSRRAGQLS